MRSLSECQYPGSWHNALSGDPSYPAADAPVEDEDVLPLHNPYLPDHPACLPDSCPRYCPSARKERSEYAFSHEASYPLSCNLRSYDPAGSSPSRSASWEADRKLPLSCGFPQYDAYRRSIRYRSDPWNRYAWSYSDCPYSEEYRYIQYPSLYSCA